MSGDKFGCRCWVGGGYGHYRVEARDATGRQARSYLGQNVNGALVSGSRHHPGVAGSLRGGLGSRSPETSLGKQVWGRDG